jgi:hypothetical protein
MNVHPFAEGVFTGVFDLGINAEDPKTGLWRVAVNGSSAVSGCAGIS